MVHLLTELNNQFSLKLSYYTFKNIIFGIFNWPNCLILLLSSVAHLFLGQQCPNLERLLQLGFHILDNLYNKVTVEQDPAQCFAGAAAPAERCCSCAIGPCTDKLDVFSL